MGRSMAARGWPQAREAPGMRLTLVMLGLMALAVAVVANAAFVGKYFTAKGNVVEVAYVTVLRVLTVTAGIAVTSVALFSRKEVVQNCCLLLVTTSVCLGVAEGALRTIDYIASRGAPTSPMGLRRSADPELVYENTPNFVEDGDRKFNSLGQRDEERSVDNDHAKIVIVGDSIESWRGFAVSQLYPRMLESILNARDPEHPVQTINLAVTGYSLHQKVEMLRYRGLAQHPALVIVGYCLNDPARVDGLQQYFKRGPQGIRVRTIEFVANRIRSILGRYGIDFYTAIHQPGTPSWVGVEQDMVDLGSIQRELGVKVIVVVFPLMFDTAVDYPWADIHTRLDSVVKENGLSVVDLLDKYRAAGFAQVRADGVHPNEIGHRIAAEELARAVSAGHLL